MLGPRVELTRTRDTFGDCPRARVNVIVRVSTYEPTPTTFTESGPYLLPLYTFSISPLSIQPCPPPERLTLVHNMPSFS